MHTQFESAALSNLFSIHFLVFGNLIHSLLNFYTFMKLPRWLEKSFSFADPRFLTGWHQPTNVQNFFLLFAMRPTFFLHSEYMNLNFIGVFPLFPQEPPNSVQLHYFHLPSKWKKKKNVCLAFMLGERERDQVMNE